jgi:anti-sigma-K factor RskA
VLGLASTEEVVEVENLRQQYPDIDKAIENFSTMLEQQALQNAVAPPEEVKAKILLAIQEDESSKAVAPVLPLKEDNAAISAPVRSMRVWRFAAAASVILFILSAVLNLYLYNKYNNQNNLYQALLIERNSLQANNQIYQTRIREWQSAAEMMADSTMEMVKMAGTSNRANMVTLFWDTRNRDVYVLPNKLPKPTPGKQYQLWALVDGKPVDAGVLDASCTSVCKMKTIPRAQAFAITLEKEGGSPTPDLNALFVMGKV